MTFNPANFAMARKQELMETEIKKPSRLIPSGAAALVITQESGDGFLDIKIVSPDGDPEYDGLTFTGMSPSHVAVVNALELLTTYMFGSESENSEDPEFVSLEDIDPAGDLLGSQE